MTTKPTAAFTIVELLIVIVVIAILAAITLVTFTGAQARTNDTAVQSDMTQIAKQLELIKAEFADYPTDQGAPSRAGVITDYHFNLTKSAYDTTISPNANAYYCYGKRGGVPTYMIASKSKSGQILSYTPSVGTAKFGGTAYAAAACAAFFDSGTWTNVPGYYVPNGGWQGWAA